MDEKLKGVAKAILPRSVFNKLRDARDYGEVRSHAFRRAKASRIQFHSGLGDSSALLYGLVRSMKPKVCVEIGSARGNSACAVASALKENGSGKLYAIDPHIPTDWNDEHSVDTFATLRANLGRLGLVEQVEIVRSMSDEAAASWRLPIDLIFIDGDHTYEGVKRDWDLFTPHVGTFGVVVFHDTIWDLRPPSNWDRAAVMGVPRFVDDLRAAGYQTITIDRDCGVTLVQPRVGGVPLRNPVTTPP